MATPSIKLTKAHLNAIAAQFTKEVKEGAITIKDAEQFAELITDTVLEQRVTAGKLTPRGKSHAGERVGVGSTQAL